MSRNNTHIGREHAHALAAMYTRASRALARGRFAEPEAAGAPAASGQPAAAVRPPPGATQPPAWRPAASQPAEPRRHAEPEAAQAVPPRADPDEDLGFLDGRWTSEGW